MQVQEAEASNQVKCEAVCAVGRLVAFQSVAAGEWLAPQLISHMVGHGKQVNLLLPEILSVCDLTVVCCCSITGLMHLRVTHSRQASGCYLTHANANVTIISVVGVVCSHRSVYFMSWKTVEAWSDAQLMLHYQDALMLTDFITACCTNNC